MWSHFYLQTVETVADRSVQHAHLDEQAENGRAKL